MTAYYIVNRVGKLRCLGNAIVPQLAAEFVRAFAGALFDASGTALCRNST